MAKFKDKILLTLGIIILVAACALTVHCVFFKTTYRFVQIDNSAVRLDGTEYEYNLRTYDEYGRMKDLTFLANKKLRDEAYLRLKTNILRGVIFWEEITFDELPKDVQFRYRKQ